MGDENRCGKDRIAIDQFKVASVAATNACCQIVWVYPVILATARYYESGVCADLIVTKTASFR
jgi:hypothetical protein